MLLHRVAQDIVGHDPVLGGLEAVDQLFPDRFLLKTGQSIPVSRLKYREMRSSSTSKIRNPW